MTPKKIAVIAITSIGILLIVGGIYTNIQYNKHQALVNEDKQRFETALNNMERFFAGVEGVVNSQEHTCYCVFDKGPWGDMNTDNPLCTVKITAKMVDYPNDRQALLDTNSKLLKWDGVT